MPSGWRFWKAFLVLPWVALKRRVCGRPWEGPLAPTGPRAPGRPVPVQVPNHLVPWLSVPLPWKVGSSHLGASAFEPPPRLPVVLGPSLSVPGSPGLGREAVPRLPCLPVGPAPGLQPPGADLELSVGHSLALALQSPWVSEATGES